MRRGEAGGTGSRPGGAAEEQDHKRRGWKDGDSAKRVEGQEVAVAAYDDCRLGGQGAGKDDIVVRIAAGADKLWRDDPLRLSPEFPAGTMRLKLGPVEF